MMEFEKQSEIMEMKEEMMNDAIDDAMCDEDDEEEGEAIVSQVLDELGLQIGDQLSGTFELRSSLVDFCSNALYKIHVESHIDLGLMARLTQD